MKHTENGIRVHKLTAGCKGPFEMEVSDKKELGKFEIYRCTGTHTRGKFKGEKCTYVGRGKKLTGEDLEKLEAKAEKAKQKKQASADAKAEKAAADELAQQAQDDGEYDHDVQDPDAKEDLE